MKKKLCFILALAFVFAAVATACKTEKGDGGTTDSTSTEAVAGTTEDAAYVDNVPDDLKYDGYEFVMAFPNPADHGLDFQLVDEGDVSSQLQSSIYNRNRIIEGRFGITLSGFCAGNSDTQTSFFVDAVLSGEDAVDLAYIAFTFSGIPWITSGQAMPWNDVPHIDTSRVYWNQDSIKNLSVAGYEFLLQGDINWPSMISTQVCFFNQPVAEENQVGNLYEVVNDSEWTFEKMRTLAKAYSKDLNNDGKYDDTDQYGIAMCYYGAVYEIGIAANYITVLQTEDGYEINTSSDKLAEIVDFAYNVIHEDGTTYLERYDYIHESKGIPIFFDNRALFMFTGLGTGDHFRNEQADYGIIPCPKWNEEQEKYCTTNDQWGLACSIPMTATNPERTGAITEALCALSGKLVYPTYYEVVLSERNTRDEESKAMLDLIFSNIIFDPGIAFAVNEVYIPIQKLVRDKSTDIASWNARYSGKVQGQFDKLYDYVVENFD